MTFAEMPEEFISKNGGREKMQWEEKIQGFELKKPGPNAACLMTLNLYKRGMNLSELTSENQKCAWCEAKPTKTRRHKYCSEDCAMSAQVNCWPQTPQCKAFLLWKQGWACKSCGLSFEDHFKTRALRRLKTQQEYWDKFTSIRRGPRPETLTLHAVGYGSGDLLHIDHKVPIFLGGPGIGLDNIQIICVNCHRKKTIEERK